MGHMSQGVNLGVVSVTLPSYGHDMKVIMVAPMNKDNGSHEVTNMAPQTTFCVKKAHPFTGTVVCQCSSASFKIGS